MPGKQPGRHSRRRFSGFRLPGDGGRRWFPPGQNHYNPREKPAVHSFRCGDGQDSPVDNAQVAAPDRLLAPGEKLCLEKTREGYGSGDQKMPEQGRDHSSSRFSGWRSNGLRQSWKKNPGDSGWIQRFCQGDYHLPNPVFSQSRGRSFQKAGAVENRLLHLPCQVSFLFWW